MRKPSLAICVILFSLLASCAKVQWTLPKLPIVTAVNIDTLTTIELAVTASYASQEAVTDCGICFDTASNRNTIVYWAQPTSNKAVHYSVRGLQPYHHYFVRAYARNVVGISFGPETEVFTLPDTTLFKVLTLNPTTIADTGFIVGVAVSNSGNYSYSSLGVCIDTGQMPTIASKTIEYSGRDTTYSAFVGGLTPNRNYVVRAFAKLQKGVVYGNIINVTTRSGLSEPIVTTKSISSNTLSSAETGGIIVSDGGSPILDKGVCWQYGHTPTISDNSGLIVNYGSTSTYETIIDGYSATTRNIHVRAYATNKFGTAYGNEIVFYPASNLILGQNFQGGYIFYIDPTGMHGEIIGADYLGMYAWGCPNVTVSGAQGVAIGSGQNNTTNIIAICGDASFAAKQASGYTAGGYGDWYLPSQIDLLTAYTSLKELVPSIFSANLRLWSSTQQSSSLAYYLDVNAGLISVSNKVSSLGVKAVRNF